MKLVPCVLCWFNDVGSRHSRVFSAQKPHNFELSFRESSCHWHGQFIVLRCTLCIEHFALCNQHYAFPKWIYLTLGYRNQCKIYSRNEIFMINLLFRPLNIHLIWVSYRRASQIYWNGDDGSFLFGKSKKKRNIRISNWWMMNEPFVIKNSFGFIH